LGRPPETCFPPGSFSRQAQNLQRVFASGESLAAENCNAIGGHEVWQHSLLVPLKDRDGQVRAVMGVSRDITASKEAEEAVRASEERYRVVSELTSDFAFAIRVQEDMVTLEWITDAVARITGLTMDEVRARGSWRRFIHPEELAPVRDILKALRRGQAIERQVRLITKAGETRWVQAYAVPARDPDSGQVVRIYGAAKDVTERKAIEQALQQSEHQYRTTIDSLLAFIHVVDHDLRILLCNASMQRWLEDVHMDSDVIGRTVFEIFPFLPAAVHDEYMRVFETGEMLFTEDITQIGGKEFVTETRKIPVLEEGQVVHVITVVLDITERKHAEEALRASEERYRAVVEDQTELICRIRPDWTVTFVNEAYCRYYGKPREELLGQNLLEHILTVDPKRIRRQIEALSRERPEMTYEDHYLLPTGQARWQQWTDRAIFDEHDRLVEIQSVGRDITKRKRAEAALQESEARYRALVEASPDAITLTDLEGRILMVNQRTAEIYGAESTDELVGKSSLELIVPADREAAVANIQRTLETGSIRGVEYRIQCKDGSSHPVELTAALLRDAQGRPQAFIGVTRDITERKRAEEALWQTKMVVEHSPVILYRLRNEPEWPFEFISENVGQSGHTAADLLSGQTSFTMLVYPDDLPQVVGEMEEHAEHGPDTFRRSYRVVLKNGQVAWVEDRVVVVRAPDGQATHFQGILLDVTENRRLEEQFRQAQKMETVGRLAGGIAHDFNNFLTAIRGYAGLVYDALRPEDPVCADVEQVLKAAERAASLTGQLLAFSRRQIIEARPVNLNDLVLETEKMLHRLIGEDIDLVLDLTSNLELVRADPSQITQALVNLVVNARDAMPDGGVLTITTANLTLAQVRGADEHAGVPPGSFITLAISDLGVGMGPEVQAHLFEPFFTTKEAGRGTGLGLATVYGIVKQHQGHIAVQSEPGRGTTIRVYLPVLKDKVRVPPRRSTSVPMPRGHETVLVVEDEPAVRALMVRVLRGLGYNVLEAGEGNTAIQVAREHQGPIHLLLTDVVMPQMDGRMVASLLQDAYEGLRVLYVSGYATDVLARYGVRAEDVAFLHKPFTGANLASKVREVLDARREDTEEGT
jgi:two-component system cell cycle sensor histidine kinase/response regulator CckA